MKRKNETGFTFIMVLVLLAVAVPMALIVMQAVRQSSLHGFRQSSRQTATQYALGALQDYFRQLTNDPYANFDAESLKRSLTELEKGNYTVDDDFDPDTNTLHLKITGAFGLNPAAPKATQVINAVLVFKSMMGAFPTEFSNIDKYHIPRNNYIHEGPIRAFNINITGSGVKFVGGPVVVINNFLHNGAGDPVPNPFIDGDLYVGGNLNLKAGAVVTGKTFRTVPPVPEFFIDFAMYENKAQQAGTGSMVFTSPVAIRFNSDGTYQYTNNMDYYILNSDSDKNQHKFDDEVEVNWSAPIAITPNTVILAKNCNIGVKGVVRGKPVVVAIGTSKSRNQGNIIFYNDLEYYHAVNGTSIYSSATNTFEAYALNQMYVKDEDWYKKSGQTVTAQDMKISGILSQAFGKDQHGAAVNPSMDHTLIVGPVNNTFTFTGTRNMLFLFKNEAYNNLFEHKHDPMIGSNAKNGPTIAELVSLSIN